MKQRRLAATRTGQFGAAAIPSPICGFWQESGFATF